MKLQYLGDSKDAFKWDYLDFLAQRMNVSYMDIVPMKTPNDSSGEGKTPPSRFSASDCVQKFCRHLRENRSLDELSKLPCYTGAKYEVRLHKPNIELKNAAQDRSNYFSDIPCEKKGIRILFLDPDIGFQPRVTPNNKHVMYSDVATIWPQITDDSIVCVFQHGRRMHCPFDEHYAEIKAGLKCIASCFSTAVYWCSDLMFVLLAKSSNQIADARACNGEYQRQPRPVQVIDG